MDFNGTFFVSIISFILFVFIMNKILYRPILDIMEERDNYVKSNYKDAQENNSRIETLADEKNEKLNNAKDDAKNKYNEIIENYKNQKAELVTDAQQKVANELENSRSELYSLSDNVKNSLKGSMNDLANDIVEKIIGYRTNIEGFDDNKVNEILWGNK